MDWKVVDTADKELINSYLYRKPTESSEMTFTNFFLWREGFQFSYKIIDDYMCVRHLDERYKCVLMMPVGSGDLKKVVLELKEEWNADGELLTFTPLIQDDVQMMQNAVPGVFELLPEPHHSDYIYSVQDLIHLPGRKFHDKKNMVNRFKRDHDFEYLPLDASLLAEVKQAADEWCLLRNCEDSPELEYEREGIVQCLEHFSKLDCEGGVIRIYGKVLAFTFGEMLNPDMVVIHIEKADPRITGAYQIINQQFLANRWADCKWVNREGDMGLEGLRQAKLSYNPDRILDKFILREKR